MTKIAVTWSPYNSSSLMHIFFGYGHNDVKRWNELEGSDCLILFFYLFWMPYRRYKKRCIACMWSSKTDWLSKSHEICSASLRVEIFTAMRIQATDFWIAIPCIYLHTQQFFLSLICSTTYTNKIDFKQKQ